MIWKDVVGYEGLYEISSLGDIKSLKRYCKSKTGFRVVPEKILKPKIDKYGYLVLHISKNNVRWNITIHRLVAIAFLPNINNYPQINHKDGNKLNNVVENLEWCSASYNVQHSFDNKLNIPIKGSKRAFSKMTEEKVIEVRYRYKNEDISLKNLSKSYNISTQTLHSIITKKTWKHV